LIRVFFIDITFLSIISELPLYYKMGNANKHHTVLVKVSLLWVLLNKKKLDKWKKKT